jgi:nitroreductase
MDKTAETKYPVHELIAKRWSPRAYSDEPVLPKHIRSLLEAARWSASAYNEQPWAFIIATKEDFKEFGRMLNCLVEFNQTWAKEAPVLMLAVAHSTFNRNGKPNPHAWYDLGQAVQNLIVQATDLGLYVHQMAGIDRDKCRETYAIPEDWDTVSAIAVGKMGEMIGLSPELQEREKAPRERKPLPELVYAGSWGKAPEMVNR